METKTSKKETSKLTVESFIDHHDIDFSRTDPVRIECGETTDESMFKPYFAQRPLNEARCRKMSKSMKRYGNFSSVQCVRKGGYLYVWDGQHVLRAATIARKAINMIFMIKFLSIYCQLKMVIQKHGHCKELMIIF